MRINISSLFSLSLIPLFVMTACSRTKGKADLLIYNAKVYTVDSAFSIAEAIVIREGKILATGKAIDLQSSFEATESIDAEGKFVYPGFIDAHCHFYRYGLGLQRLDLTGTKSWEEILHHLSDFSKSSSAGEWIIGRGWDQNDWNVKEFPTNTKLNELYPDRPVILTRIDGHAAIVNQKAIELAGIKAGPITGGEVELKNGKLTGILIDNAMDLAYAAIPSATPVQIKASLQAAQRNCFAVGLTTVDDCGLDYTEVNTLDSLQKTGDVKMRVYAMLSDAKRNYDYLFSKGKIKTDYLNVRSFKVYADGALGSRGACLLHPYNDKPGLSGFLLSSAAHFDSVAQVLYNEQFQMCTHAIGDSGNRVILNIYAKYLKGKNDLRWRIEHAQVINENDFALFEQNSVIPSVQPTHATSDMYWAGTRLGKEREKGAYAFNDLLKQNGWIPLGTDFPVEDISPFKTFYAAVVRKDAKGWPAEGYQMKNALSREDALKGMTIWAAKSNFEEKEKGSIEKGKFADLVILDKDIMTIAPAQILQVQVNKTIINGKIVFERK